MRTADPQAPTKEKLLEAAQKLMLAQGFTATSVDEICAEAGATKGSFFHFFKNKEDLAKVLLERYTFMRLAMMEQALEGVKEPRARVLRWCDTVIAAMQDPQMAKNCIIGNFTQELAPTQPAMRSHCAENMARMTGPFVAELKAAKARHPEELADMFFSLMQGSMTVAKARGIEVGVSNMKHFRRYLESQLP